MPYSPSLETELRQFVDREVYYCVSQLISHLAKDVESEYYDDILSVCFNNDYKSAAYECGYQVKKDDDGNWFWFESLECKRSKRKFNAELDAWLDCCEVNNIEPEQTEAYEHWIVSEWLADKLAVKGQMVCKDIYGLTIWGRCATGQAISLDDVISKIYEEVAR